MNLTFFFALIQITKANVDTGGGIKCYNLKYKV